MAREADESARTTLMRKAHKIRLNPTLEQEQWLLQASGTARFTYNWGLAEWQRQYEAGEKPSAYVLKKQFNAIRREQFPWSMEISKCAVDTGFRNLDTAFSNFFRRCKNGDTKKGYPRFKSKRHSKKSFRMDGSRVKIDGHWLKLEKLDEPINMAEMLRFDGGVKSVTISEDAGHWYVAVNVEVEPPEHKHPQESVGVDLGIKALAVLSNGREFENQKLLRLELRKLKRLNRELSRRQEGSGRWNCTKAKLARFHRRIANRRLDCQHKMTTDIASTYQIIGVEDLNVAGMLRNHRLALSIADAGFGEIQRQLSYKSAWYGGVVVEIDRFFPSSKLCHFCGCINGNLTLAEREWTCECGAVLNRDLNAALNIERQALNILRRSGFTEQVKNGRGEGVRPFGAILVEASKMDEERRPSIPAVV
ncbi:MAG: putative transposase [Parcubacteria group bacterium ADurb.Bin192]|nr:MAG: putative transposase [Parcubacteria group bacterium ADurb.Bin192]